VKKRKRSKIVYIMLAVLFIAPLTNLGQTKWSPVVDIASRQYGNNSPRIDITRNGQVNVIWGGNGNIYYSRRSTSTFSEPLVLNPQGLTVAQSYWMGPEMSVYGDSIMIVFKTTPENNSNNHIYSISSSNKGDKFNDTVRVDFIGSDLSRFPTISNDEFGNVAVAYMKFAPNFAEPHWVVALSNDLGNSYGAEFELGEMSSSEAEACDCCPGSVSISNGKVALAYRNNDDNIRDIRVGTGLIANRTADTSFDMDGNNWKIFNCPASAPAVFINKDSLYSVFMSGGSGDKRVYASSASMVTSVSNGAQAIEDGLSNLVRQDFPRISKYGLSAATVWTQIRNGKIEIGFAYSDNIETQDFEYLEAIPTTNAQNADVAIFKDSIYVVWQDNASRTVKYKAGSIWNLLDVSSVTKPPVNVIPNPTNDIWNIYGLKNESSWTLQNYMGQPIKSGTNNEGHLKIPTTYLSSGVYWLQVETDESYQYFKLIRN
jgi:hypothetical protein